jgi:hypothetical protein
VACFATSAVCRCGRTRTLVVRPIRVVTGASLPCQTAGCA